MIDGKTTRRALLATAPFVMAGAAFAQEQPESAYILDTGLDAVGRPVAEVRVNGQGPFRFLVDTGATTTVIKMDLAIALGLTFNGTATIYGTTGSADMPVAKASEVVVGSVTKNDLRLIAMTLPLGARADGIIGADVFAGKRVVFDLNRKTVKIAASRGQRSVKSDTSFRLRGGRLAEVRGWIGRTKAGIIIDTGADCCLVNPVLREQLRVEHPRMKTVDRVVVTGLTGQVLEGEGLYLPGVSMNGLDVSKIVAVGVDAPVFRVWDLHDEPAMIMGADVLLRLPKFSIDYGAAAFDVGPFAMLSNMMRGSWT